MRQSPQVFTMLPDYEHGCQHEQYQLPGIGIFSQSPREDRKRRCGCHGSERNVAEYGDANQKDACDTHDRLRGNQGERSEASRHALATTEPQPDWEHVSENGKEGGDDESHLLVRGDDECARNQDCCQALARVERERRDAKCRRASRHVCRTNVAATPRANVFTQEDADKEVSERN